MDHNSPELPPEHPTESQSRLSRYPFVADAKNIENTHSFAILQSIAKLRIKLQFIV